MELVGLRISPIGVLKEKKKLRIIHILPFSGGRATVRKPMWTRNREMALEIEGRSVNADTAY